MPNPDRDRVAALIAGRAPASAVDLREALAELIKGADAVIAAWEGGDLVDAVNMLQESADGARDLLAPGED